MISNGSRILIFHFRQRVGDISGQIEPLLSSFDEPTPLTAIPSNAIQLKRLDEEDSSGIQIDDEDDDNDGRATGAGADDDDDDDAKIPLLTSPEVISCVACDSIQSFTYISYFHFLFDYYCHYVLYHIVSSFPL